MKTAYKQLPTFVMNLKKRTDRRENIGKQFDGRNEFAVTIVDAIENDAFGAMGLWHTICHILRDLAKAEDDLIILCEDDIQFTDSYSPKYLFSAIQEARVRGADALLGGISWFTSTLQISQNLFWVENFSGLQFTVIFRKFFNTILEASLENYDAADYHIAALTRHVMLLHPFIAIQREFGYSDATPRNNQKGRITALFEATAERMGVLNSVKNRYQDINAGTDNQFEPSSYANITIPTYIINHPAHTDQLAQIKQQFNGREEFDVTITTPVEHEVAAYGYWLKVREIITAAITNDDDVIILCADDHEFTADYSKTYLLRNIIEAHNEGANYLSGCTGDFGHAIPITENRYWVNYCRSAQFMVLYKNFFQKILDEPFHPTIVIDLLYSNMTSNKMVLYPFISLPRDNGATFVTDNPKAKSFNVFAASEKRFRIIQEAYRKYQPVALSH